MSALITTRFYNSGIPATGLSPVISIIKQSDGSAVITGGSMVEVSNGFYSYEFTQYSPMELYFFALDGGATLSGSDRYKDSINELDSYGNKSSRGRNSQVIVDTKGLAKEVWEAKTSEYNKDGTFGNIVQREATFDGIITSISDIVSKVESSIKSIKIPTGLTKTDIREQMEGAIEGIDIVGGVKQGLDEYEKKENYKEGKYDDTEIVECIEEIKKYIVALSKSQLAILDKQDSLSEQFSTIDTDELLSQLKEMDIDKLVESLSEGVEKFGILNKEKDASISHIQQMNKDMQELKFTLKSFFTRINMK